MGQESRWLQGLQPRVKSEYNKLTANKRNLRLAVVASNKNH